MKLMVGTTVTNDNVDKQEGRRIKKEVVEKRKRKIVLISFINK